MASTHLSEKLRLFIFQHIDSVELVEVLLQLKNESQQWQTAGDISRLLRSSQSSVQGRLTLLVQLGIAEEKSDSAGAFRYQPQNPELNELVTQLLEEYRLRRHGLLELIFSPAKQARKFADAFVLGKDSDKKGGGYG